MEGAEEGKGHAEANWTSPAPACLHACMSCGGGLESKPFGNRAWVLGGLVSQAKCRDCGNSELGAQRQWSSAPRAQGPVPWVC